MTLTNCRFPVFYLFLFLSFMMTGCTDDGDQPDPDEPIEPDPVEFAIGVDLSYVNQIEDNGGIYKKNNQLVDPFEVLSEHGATTVRVRLWHNPDWVLDLYDGSSPLYSGYEDVEKTITRAKEAGMEVLLDIQYSDIWADPGNQEVPAAWKDIKDIQVLSDSVYNYTYSVLSRLASKDLLPELVQVGNETNCGMMFSNTEAGFPSLNVCDGNWIAFGKVVNAAISAIRQIDEQEDHRTTVVFHVADPKNLEWWLNDIIHKAGVLDFQVMGFSYYHIWHNTIGFNDIPALIKRLKETYYRDFMLLETAYPFTTGSNDSYSNIYYSQPIVEDFEYTVEGQKEFMATLTQNLMDAGAKGVFYWEPAWITSDMTDPWGVGSSWENCAFFDFSGNLTGVVDYLGQDYE